MEVAGGPDAGFGCVCREGEGRVRVEGGSAAL